jgi:hypothetical protein
LRIPDGELAAILDFAILHGIAKGQDAVGWLRPIDDINPLFGNKIAKTHEGPPLQARLD